MAKCQKDPTCGIFLKRGLFRGIKNDIYMCQMRKCKGKCQKDPTCGIFLKRQLFKDVFWVSHSCTRSSYLTDCKFCHLNWMQIWPLGSTPIANFATRCKCYLHWLQSWPLGGAKCIGCKFGTIVHINIDIFQKCQYIDNRYSILIYRTGLSVIHLTLCRLLRFCPEFTTFGNFVPLIMWCCLQRFSTPVR